MSTTKSRLRVFSVLFATIAFSLGAAPSPAAAATVATGPIVTASVHNDLSAPLISEDQQGDYHDQYQTPSHRVPKGPGQGTGNSLTPGTGSVTPRIPSTSLSFSGVGNGFSGPQGSFTVSSAPPDPNGAVGPNHYVQIVNSSFAIFDKTGTAVYGPVATNTLWSGFDGGCQTNNDGDATVAYDRIADRFVFSQFSVTTTPFLQCLAISQTADPTGAYYRYSFQYSDFNDYPKLSVWPDAYYVTYNMFNAAGTAFHGGEVCALDRTKMLAGQAATQQCFNVGTTYGGLLASDFDGRTLPPSGEPNLVVALGPNVSDTTLATWKFHADWTNTANTTLTGPSSLTVSPYTEACSGGTCIPQSGTTQQLDSLADRLMYRLAYRNFGDHESLVVNHSIANGSSVGLRWYELRLPGGNPSVYQQGTYAPDSNFRWMGSIAMDQAGNVGLGFSLSSSSVHPQIHYTGRLAADAAGTMTQGEGTILNGAGSQTGSNLSRWGDYSSMSVDPVDDCTFWYTNEYIPSNGAFNWSTRIANFKFPSCGTPPPSNDFSIAANPSSLLLAPNTSGTSTISTAITAGSAQTVNLAVSGAPSGASASLSPTSVTSGGSSTLTVNSGGAAAGTYTLTVTGTGTSATHSTTVSLNLSGPPPPTGITNGGFETGNLSGWTSAGSTSISTTAHSGTYSAMVGSPSPTNGDSSIAQTFSAPASGGNLTFYYRVTCPDTLTYDWATATLADTTAGTTTTVLQKTCSNTGAWANATAPLTGSHAYRLTLVSHDDNYSTDPTYALFDDVTIGAPPPPPDFTISASPSSLSIQQGSSGSSMISTAAVNSAGTVNLSAAVSPSGPTASLSPTSVSAGAASTLTVNVGGGVATGSYTVSVTGTEGANTHSTTVAVTVTAPAPNPIVNGGFETGNLSGWTSAGTTAVVSGSAHSGTNAARIGGTSPTNGDSSVRQTFTAASAGGTVAFYYNVKCPDTLTYDWATATLRDNTAGTTRTVLARTCTNNNTWNRASATLTASHSYTLTLISHDDNYTGDPTYTLYDDVTVT